MKILLKILVAPFALALSLLAALLVFLFDICAVLLTIASVILVVLGYFMVYPLTLRFLSTYQLSAAIENQISLNLTSTPLSSFAFTANARPCLFTSPVMNSGIL